MNRILKHSKQRDSLIELLKSTKSHPTADWLYSKLKKEYPSLSLATVYRNLGILCEIGEAIKIDVGDGVEHYDATVEDHCHFICSGCNSLIDVNLPYIKSFNKDVEKINNVVVDSKSIVFYGKCEKCR